MNQELDKSMHMAWKCGKLLDCRFSQLPVYGEPSGYASDGQAM